MSLTLLLFNNCSTDNSLQYIQIFSTDFTKDRVIYDLTQHWSSNISNYHLDSTSFCPSHVFTVTNNGLLKVVAQDINITDHLHCVNNGTAQYLATDLFSCFIIGSNGVLSVALTVEIHIIPVQQSSIPSAYMGMAFSDTANSLVQIDGLLTTEGLGVLYYSIVSGNDHNTFDVINTISNCYSYSRLITLSTLTVGTVYNLTIVGSAYNKSVAYANVLIEAITYNKYTPQLMNICSIIYLERYTPTGATLVHTKAVDFDKGANGMLHYTLPSSSSYFSINPISGDLYLAKSLVQHTANITTVTIEVKDYGYPVRSTEFNVTIFITEINRFAPHINISALQNPVSEHLQINNSIGKIVVSDKDSSNISVTLQSTSCIYCFKLSKPATTKNDGRMEYDILLNRPLDYESSNSRYTLTIIASDNDIPPLTSKVTVTINVTDENDPPYFPNGNYFKVSVSEKSHNGTQIVFIGAYDEDNGPEGQLIYSIINGNENNLFTVDSSTGLVTVAVNTITLTPSDFRNIPLNISVQDSSVTSLISYVLVNVTIDDIDNNVPVFATNLYQRTVPESWNISDPIFAFEATDSDSGCSGALKYTIIRAEPPVFNIDQVSGLLYANTQLDYESYTSANITVQVTSLGNNPGFVSEATLNLIITDVNDNLPVINTISCPCFVMEEQPTVQHCYPLTVHDDDANSQYTFMISSGNEATKFTIDSLTGIVSTLGSLDRETQSSYSLVIVASDGVTLSNPVTLNVVIVDINDSPPIYSGSFKLNVSLDTSDGYEITSLAAVHNDVGYNGLTRYELASNTAANVTKTFFIDPLTGGLFLKQDSTLMYGDTYYFDVIATDVLIPNQQSQTDVSITITDPLNIAPSFLLSYNERRVSKNSPLHTVIATVQAYDADTVQYSIVGGNIYFNISQSTGSISTTALLTDVTATNIMLNISATDGMSTSFTLLRIILYSPTISIAGSILTQNPAVGVCAYNGSITENSNSQTNVIELIRTQSDLQVTYAIVGGQFMSSFSIDGNYILRTNSGHGTVFDRDVREAIYLTLRAVYGNLFHYCSVTIAINDVNDNRPVFDSNHYSAEIYEPTPVGSSIHHFHATDNDVGSNAITTYSLVTPSAHFAVHNTTGIVSTLTTLSASTYTISVLASDVQNQLLNSTTTLTVHVLSIPNSPPVVSPPTTGIQLILQENHTINSFITSIAASDSDNGSQGQLKYCIQYGNYKGQFSIGPDGELFLIKRLDYEEQPYLINLTLLVYDSSPNVQRAIDTVEITIHDVNDEYPLFLANSYYGNVKELSLKDTFVLTVNAVDKDDSDIITYSISPRNDKFNIDSLTGDITVASQITRSSVPNGTVSLTVLATDSIGHTSTAQVTITVLDINYNRPHFQTPNGYAVNIPESTSTDYVLLQVFALDSDSGINSEIRYWISSGNINDIFSLDSKTGNITLSRTVDYETDPHDYTLTIQATDLGEPSLIGTNSISIALHITDINDNYPLFSKVIYICTISEGTGNVLKSIHNTTCQVNANDADAISNTVTYYTNSNYFNIDSNTGVISSNINGLIDYENTTKYFVTVIATDGGNPTKTSTAVVIVRVVDNNDNSPHYDTVSTVLVPQYLPANTLLFYVHAKDDDQYDTVSYSLLSNTDVFTLNSTTGSVHSAIALSDTTIYTIRVLAAVESNGRSQDFNVIVNKVNRNSIPPQFTTDNSPLVAVYSTASISQYVTTITTYDPDYGSDGITQYYIISGSGYGYFQINTSTGIISVNYPLTGLTLATLTLVIMATDSGSYPLYALYNLTVAIIPDSNIKPFFDTPVYYYTVNQSYEHSSNIVGHVRAIINQQSSVNILYQLSTDTVVPFTVHNTTGAIVVNGAPVNEEYTFNIEAYHVNITNSRSKCLVIVTILDDLNDFRPSFPAGYNHISIPSTLLIHTSFVKLFVIDQDFSNLISTFSMSQTDAPFSIDSYSGEIELIAIPTNSSYNLTITAHNGQLNQQQELTIAIYTPVNTSTESFTVTSNHTISIPDSTVIGTLVYIVTCNTSNPLLYSIDNNTSSSYDTFSIHPNTGGIYLSEPLVQMNYTIAINVWDGYTEPVTFILTLLVLESTGNRPKFAESEFKFDVHENVPPNTIVGVVSTNLPLNQFEIVDSLIVESISLFNISMEGALMVLGPLDREKFNSHILTVSAKNMNSGLQNFARVTININDINDNHPVFLNLPTYIIISEDIPIGQFVTTLCAFDPDTQNYGNVKYLLLNSADVPFVINEQTGDISTNDTLDFEQSNQYTLQVLAYNPSDTSSNVTQNFIISVSDIIDSFPNLTGSDSAFVYENQPPLTYVANTALNNIYPVTYSILAGNEMHHFLIEPFTGIIRTLTMLDRESIDTYNLTVRGSFNAEYFTNVTVIVRVKDVNDHTPYLGVSNLMFLVTEGAKVFTDVIIDLDIQDNDEGLNKTINNVVILEPDANDVFSISNNGLVTLKKPLDRETKDIYRFEVLIVDSGPHNPLHTTEILTVIVGDVNDNSPQFDQPSYEFTAVLPSLPEEKLFSVTATDIDQGINGTIMSYAITGGSGVNVFAINELTGTVTLNQRLNLTSEYSLIISATDGGGRSSYVNVNVILKYCRFNLLAFQPSSYSITLPENATIGTEVVTFNINDFDISGDFEFSVVTQSDHFNITSSTGILQIQRSLDRETETTYNVVVQVHDTSSTSLRIAEASVTIIVTDINDNQPIFVNTPYAQYILDTVSVGTQIFRVFARDNDTGQNSEIVYTVLTDPSSSFSIDSVSGVLTLVQPLDASLYGTHIEIDVKATDKGSPPLHSNATVRLTIINSNAPNFSQPLYTKSISESASEGEIVLTVSASTNDDNSQLFYSISDIFDSKFPFSINPNTGVITVNDRGLDYETKVQYTFNVKAEDIISTLSSQSQIEIYIIDYNDEVPLFSEPLYIKSVPETVNINTTILTVSATDLDTLPNSQLTYSLLSNFVFDINPLTGDVQTLKALDYENQTSYQFTVYANDSGTPSLQGSATIRVIVTNVNDNPPVFNMISTLTVSEGAEPGTLLTFITATDLDNDDIEYTLIPNGVGSNNFTLSIDGLLYLNSDGISLTDIQYLLNISANDGLHVTNTTLTILISDVNNHSPVFNQSVYYATVVENSPAGVQLAQVFATDNDRGSNAEIHYSVQSSYFRINSSTGIISTTSMPTNREQTEVHNLIVVARDGGNRTDTAGVVITVLDTNDNRPTFTQTSFAAFVQEGDYGEKSVGVLTVTATDPDHGSNGTITYTIVNSTNDFDIDSTSGLISAIGTLDYETFPTHSFLVLATDGGGLVSNYASVTINVTNVADTNPSFSQDTYLIYVPENSPFNSFVFRPNVTFSESCQPTGYSIYDSPIQLPFIIISSNGDIRIAGHLDRESQDRYEFTILVECTVISLDLNGFPVINKRFDSATISVNITDVNEEPELSAAFITAVISEAAPINTTVDFVSATDSDLGNNGTVLYELLEDQDVPFDVNSESGTIYVSETLDRETQDFYTFRIRAYDLGSPPLSSTATVYIAISDVNDFPPNFVCENYTEDNVCRYNISIPEDTPPNTVILEISIEDSDLISNINFTLSSAVFNASSSGSNGIIRTSSVLDRELTDTYQLQLLANDGIFVTRALLDIDITDINDNAPQFDTESFQVTVMENFPINIVFTTVNATDIDEGDNAIITYSFLPSLLTNNVSLDATTGDVSFLISPDFEDSNRLELHLRAADIGNLEHFATLQIHIIDDNDNYPVFSSNNYSAMLYENRPNGTDLIYVTATDADSGSNALISYSLDVSSQKYFSIDSSLGLITSNASIDRETISNFTMTVIATDNGKTIQLSTETIVTVTILDINDNPPVFTDNQFTAHILEGVSIGTTVDMLNVSDADEGTNSILIFDITGENEEDFAHETVPGGVAIKVARKLNHESVSRYELIIRAIDGGFPTHSTSVNYTIIVLDENDNIPSFQFPVYKLSSIPENTPIDTVIITVTAIDLDSADSNLIYSFIDPVNDFSIDSQSGKISVSQQLDFETVTSYTLRVRASEPRPNPQTAVATVEITITDVNDNPPQFLCMNLTSVCPTQTLNIYENQPPQVLANLSVQDIDTVTNLNAISFDITTKHIKDGQTLFVIDPLSGQLSVTAALDREEQDLYVIQVIARDDGNPIQLTGTVYITLNVMDLNDNVPQNGTQEMFINLLSGQLALSNLGSVFVNDSDIINAHQYSLLSNDAFNVDPLTGVITFSNQLLSDSSFTLHISITDTLYNGTISSASTYIFIQVTNFTTSTQINSFNILLLQITPELFIKYHLSEFNLSVNSILSDHFGSYCKLVFISIKTSQLYLNSTEVSIAATVANGDYIEPDLLQHILYISKQQVSLYTNLTIYNEDIDPCSNESECTENTICTSNRTYSLLSNATTFDKILYYGLDMYWNIKCSLAVVNCNDLKCPPETKCVEDKGQSTCAPNECSLFPCKHGGTCIDQLPAGYYCICPNGYSGPNCELNTATFTGNSYVLFSSTEHTQSISFDLITDRSEGVLLYAGHYDPLYRDFILMYITNGTINSQLSFGGNTYHLNIDDIPVNDKLWYTVVLDFYQVSVFLK